MKPGIIAIFGALLLPFAGCKSSQQSSSPDRSSYVGRISTLPQGSGFDFYLLNLSWSPEFCHGHPNAIECAARSTFVLHGLWPQNTSGTFPENCSNAPGPPDPSQFKDIYPDLGLLQHEWRTHGTCSGLSADTFFQTARAAVHTVTIPPTFNTLTSQLSLPPDQIVDLFTAANPAVPRSSFAVSCGNNYLTAIEVCLDKSLHPVPCTGIRSCRANPVRIPAP